MKRRYEHGKKLGPAKLAKIAQANRIIDEYERQGLTLTLRQLYYQFVSRDLIANKDREYKNLGAAITDGRMAGLIDWRAIEDRTRFIRGNSHWSTPADVLDSAAASFRFDLWRRQEQRVEVWIEKDALVGVIDQICRQLDVDYFSCRGYVSSSEMWNAAQRIGRYLDAGQQTTILHLGDHDPSGMQMTDDIRNRLEAFCNGDIVHDSVEAFTDDGLEQDDIEAEVGLFFGERENAGLIAPTVERIALTMDQVRDFNPPPNPAKLTDSRAGEYVREFGYQSWELDALDPTTLRNLISDHVEALRDDDQWESDLAEQNEARTQLTAVADKMREEWAD